MKEKTPQKKKKRRWVYAVLASAAVLTVLLLDSKLRLVSTRYELYYDDLPESFDGFSIVQISDLHLASFGEDNARLLELVSAQQPDIIAITGDAIEKRSLRPQGEQTKKLTPFLNKLALIAPCYFVSGNHEWASGELTELRAALEKAGIKYLHNEFVLLGQDEQIVLGGVEDPNGPADMTTPEELVNIIRSNYPDAFTVLLGHRNYWLEKYPQLPVDIILSGHAHGGVVRLPFLGGVFGTEMDLFPKYDAGLFNNGSYDLVISRGLGGSVPVPRLFNNPELVTVILRRGE